MGRRRCPLLLATLTIALASCATIGKQVTVKAPPSLREYKTVVFGSVNNDTFLSTHPEHANAEDKRTAIQEAETRIRARIVEFYRDRNLDMQGGKTLYINVELTDFDAGVRALRQFVGFGAGKGRVGYRATLHDADTKQVLGEFFVYGTILGGNFGGGIDGAYDKCAREIIEFVEQARGGSPS